MSKNKQQGAGTRELELAQYQAAEAKKRFNATLGALQYRLKPGTIANTAWGGVREKSSEMADDAMEAVGGLADGAMQVARERPMAAYGAAAGILLFLARAPLWRAVSSLFSGGREDEGVVRTDLQTHQKVELTAPTVQRSLNEGVNA